MANYASALIKVADAEVGYLEKATNSQLDSKTANAGYNNWNKYARDMDTKYPKFLNGKKNGYDWCAIFVIWCFIKAFGEAIAHILLCQPTGSLGAGCTGVVNYYKSKGQWHDRTATPKVGDQIIFQDGGEPCHTGIVYKVDNTYVYTIEGNTSSGAGVVANGGCVARKQYNRGSYYILGYGRPNFDKEPVKTTSVTVKSNGIIYQYAWKDVVTGASKPLKHIKKGDKVSYIPDSDDGYGWCKVKSGNVTGWVMNKHLNKSGLSSFKVRTLAAKKTATIIKNGKKVGTKVLAKGTNYTEICTIEKGANLGKTYISVGSARYFI